MEINEHPELQEELRRIEACDERWAQLSSKLTADELERLVSIMECMVDTGLPTTCICGEKL